MKSKFPSGKYAADRKWLLLEAKRRSFSRFFKFPFALLLMTTYGQRRPGLGKLEIRKTIFYKPMGLCVFVLRVFHIIIRIICENNDHFGIFVSLGVQGADNRENTHTSG